MLKIKDFELYVTKPNTVYKEGHLYTKTYHFNTKNRYKNRLVRVYLPSNYDFSNPNKRFPVLYMLDGKNLFDDYTSFVGEWKVDEIVEDLISKKLSEGIIVVGIDAPKNGQDRHNEMSIPGLISRGDKIDQKGQGYADVLGDFIFKTVKKEIDETFYTLSAKAFTGVGGSSMGGLMAFYLASSYQEYIDYALCFSPAFFLYKYKDLKENYLLSHLDNLPRLYFYVGGNGFEEKFVKSTFKVYDLLREIGYSHDHLLLTYDSQMEHNEKAWSKYLEDALKFAFKINRI